MILILVCTFIYQRLNLKLHFPIIYLSMQSVVDVSMYKGFWNIQGSKINPFTNCICTFTPKSPCVFLQCEQCGRSCVGCWEALPSMVSACCLRRGNSYKWGRIETEKSKEHFLTPLCCFFFSFQIIAFDELRTDFKNPIDQSNPTRAVRTLLFFPSCKKKKKTKH